MPLLSPSALHDTAHQLFINAVSFFSIFNGNLTEAPNSIRQSEGYASRHTLTHRHTGSNFAGLIFRMI